MKPVLLDTGVIVASLDRSEKYHHQALRAIADIRLPLVTCEAVIAESCYLLRRIPGAAEAVIENVVEGIFQIPSHIAESGREVLRILAKYRDRHIDLADSCLIHLANTFQTGEILTLDGDFDVYRWGRSNRFHNLVALH